MNQDPTQNELPPPPLGLVQKAHFARQLIGHGALPEGSIADAMIVPVWQAMLNVNELRNGGSERLQYLVDYFSAPETDLFKVQSVAETLRNDLLRGIEKPDAIDLLLAVHSHYTVATKAASLTPKRILNAHYASRHYALEAVLHGMLIRQTRWPPEGPPDLWPLYTQMFDNIAPPDWMDSMQETIDHLHIRIGDYISIPEIVLDGELRSANRHDVTPNTYNGTLSNKARESLNKSAADTIERLHLLKAYGIVPVVVPAETVQLPWDISIVPPLGKDQDTYAEGAIADFILLKPNPNRTHGLLRFTVISSAETEIQVGDDPDGTVQRFRLHDNGQISFGRIIHNTPNDLIEELFMQVDAHDAFIRLRGLLIALAYDSVVPDKVLRESTGGSVASQFREIRERAPRKEPVTELLLRRQQELQRARVNNRKRTPSGWERPATGVAGYMPRLPEGSKARPDAEQEAREYYASKGIAFDGLLPGTTFTRPYKRGTGPEQTEFRRARFRNSSATKQHLGNLGIK